jgi:hypothetical protein
MFVVDNRTEQEPHSYFWCAKINSSLARICIYFFRQFCITEGKFSFVAFLLLYEKNGLILISLLFNKRMMMIWNNTDLF